MGLSANLHEAGAAGAREGWQRLQGILLDAGACDVRHKLQPNVAVGALAVSQQLSILGSLRSGFEALQETWNHAGQSKPEKSVPGASAGAGIG